MPVMVRIEQPEKGLMLFISETNRWNWPAHPGDPAFITYIGTEHPGALDDLLDNIGYRVCYKMREGKRTGYPYEAKVWGLRYADAIALSPNPAPNPDPLAWWIVDRVAYKDDWSWYDDFMHMAYSSVDRI